MKALAFIFILLVLAGMAWAVAAWINQRRRQHALEHGEWKIEERTISHRRIGIFLVKPGEPDQLFGEPISMRLPEYEFEETLIERRVGAEAMMHSLNRRLS